LVLNNHLPKGSIVKRIGLIIGVLSLSILGVLAPVASAVTKGQAGEISNHYAEVTWGVGDVEHCDPSGKNKVGEAQYYCYGYADQWRVNVGPNGEITYAGLT
jgi:hypothetical protein